jgi:hypothetical protein
MENTERKPDLSALLEVLPPFVSRNHPKLKEWTGFSGRTLANMDCIGQGIAGRILLGRVVAYPKNELVKWLESRSKVLSEVSDYAK